MGRVVIADDAQRSHSNHLVHAVSCAEDVELHEFVENLPGSIFVTGRLVDKPFAVSMVCFSGLYHTFPSAQSII